MDRRDLQPRRASSAMRGVRRRERLVARYTTRLDNLESSMPLGGKTHMARRPCLKQGPGGLCGTHKTTRGTSFSIPAAGSGEWTWNLCDQPASRRPNRIALNEPYGPNKDIIELTVLVVIEGEYCLATLDSLRHTAIVDMAAERLGVVGVPEIVAGYAGGGAWMCPKATTTEAAASTLQARWHANRWEKAGRAMCMLAGTAREMQ